MRECSPRLPAQDNAFVQFTVQYNSQQRFAAYNAKGKLVAGDPERLVRDLLPH